MEEPVVSVELAHGTWEVYDTRLNMWDPVYGCMFSEDKQQREEITAMLQTHAEQFFKGHWDSFLAIQEDDIVQLQTFFLQNPSMRLLSHMQAPVQLRSCAPHLFSSDAFTMRSSISISLIEMNDAAKLGIMKRLLSASAPLLSLNEFPVQFTTAAMQMEFDKITRQCCAFFLKPLAYINHGRIPPYSLHKMMIHFNTT
eukprot:843619-Rhodomonas_salina.1